MLTYLLLAGPGVAAGDAAARDRIVRAAAPEVLLQVAEPTLWSDESGSCLLWTWESSAERFGGSHVHADGRGVVALAGSAWSRTAWATSGALADDDALTASPAELRAHLTGCFSAVAVARDGRGHVTTDDTGTGHAYLARGSDVWAVSNRAPLAAIGLHGRWEPDLEAQGWMAMLAMFGPTDTSVRGVELLPASSAVVLVPGGVPTLETGTTPWEEGAFASGSLPDALDAAAHALTERASVIASSTVGTPVVYLSGGKDSRLVLASFIAAGRAGDVRFRTFGQPGAADREVAVLLAQRHGLDLDVVAPEADTGPTLPELDQLVRRHAFQTAGMFGAFDLKASFGTSTELNLTGLFGELMRTIYRFDRPLDTPEEGVDHLLHQMAWDRQGLLRPEARARLDDRLRTWAESRLARGWTPRSLLDLFYAEVRVARWVGGAEESNALNPTANLLQLRECIRAGFAAAPEARSQDELHHRLIEMLHPSLLADPLAQKDWHPSLGEPGSDRNPAPVHSTVEGSEAWQVRGWRSHRRLIGAELLAADNPLHEILDVAEVARVVASPRSPRRVAQVFAIWAGSIWASGGYEVSPWNGPPTPAVVPPSRVVAALTLPKNAKAERTTASSPAEPPARGWRARLGRSRRR